MEGALESRLFERHPDGLKLTHAGEETLEFVRRLNDDISELKRHVAGRDQQVSGVVRLTAAEVVGSVVCRALPGLAARHPQLHIELAISDAMANLERHEVDIAVRVADKPPEQLVGSRLGRSAVGLFASQVYVEEHGRDPKSRHHRWVAWPRAVEHKPAFQWLASRYPDRQEVLRVSSAFCVLEAVRSGVGIAPLALAQAAGEGSLTRLELLPQSCSTAVWLLTHREVRQTARVRAVMDYLGHALRDVRAALEGK